MTVSLGPSASIDARLFRWLDRLLTGIVATVLFFMMALTFVDVFARYLFSAPVPGGFELIEFGMAFLVFSALPLVTRDDGHIVVSLFDGVFRHRLGWLRRLIVLGLSTFIVGMISDRMWVHGDLLREGQHVTGFLEWPVYPIAYVMSVLSGLTVLILLGMLWRHVRGDGEPPRPSLDSSV